MTNAVMENGVDDTDLLAGLDAEETAFIDGPANESAMEKLVDTSTAVEAEDVSPVAVAEITAPPEPIDPEILSLRQQLDKLRSQLCQREFSYREVQEQSAKIRELAADVTDRESAAKEAKAELTAAKERYDSAVRELRGMIEDRGRGQRRLALGLPAAVKAEETPAKSEESPQISAEQSTESYVTLVVPSGPDEHADSPITVLGQKEMIAQFGKDTWQAAKDKEEPFGLAKGELEILETAEIATVGDLEKRMREDAWWHEKIPKMGEKKIAKLVETLRVWRTKFPMPA